MYALSQYFIKQKKRFWLKIDWTSSLASRLLAKITKAYFLSDTEDESRFNNYS